MADYITPAHIGDYSAVTDYWAANGYPVMARDEYGQEGAVKRYVPFPSVDDFRKIACFNLANLAPQTYSLIDDAFLETYLTSAMSELEMNHGCSFVPCEYFQSFDYNDDIFRNWGGLRLNKWPAIGVLEFLIKIAHTQTTMPLAEYAMPGQWVALRMNKVNLLADLGTIRVTNRASGGAAMVPSVNYYASEHRPAMLEIRYKAGFENGKMPAVVADWLITHASIRFLSEVVPMLFPYTSTSVSIDGVTQSAGLPGPQFCAMRVEALKLKARQQLAAIKNHFGVALSIDFVGVG